MKKQSPRQNFKILRLKKKNSDPFSIYYMTYAMSFDYMSKWIEFRI